MTIVRVAALVMTRLRAVGGWLRQQAALRWRSVVILVPVAAIALGLAGYGVWWRMLADRVQETLSGIQGEQKALGRNLEWSALTVDGFPYMVDATLSKTRLLAPDIGTVWDGDRVVVRLRPLSPGSIKISLEGPQHFLHVANGRWIEGDVEADTAVISGRSKDTVQALSAEFERLTGKGRLDAADVSFILERGAAGIALNAAPGAKDLPRLDMSLQVTNLALQGQLTLPLGPAVDSVIVDIGLSLPRTLPVATADAVLAAWRATATPVEIRTFAFDWGGVYLSASGAIMFNAEGLPEGNLKLTIGNHSRMLQVLEEIGWISSETHARAKPILDVMAFVSGDPKRKISVPLRFAGQDVYLGPARVLTLAPPARSGDPTLP
ncbi:MAG: DUF2125 domain-containing protein [Phycisphaerae bacterium]